MLFYEPFNPDKAHASPSIVQSRYHDIISEAEFADFGQQIQNQRKKGQKAPTTKATNPLSVPPPQKAGGAKTGLK